MKKILFVLTMSIFSSSPIYSQLYTGMSGLIHVPSAEMGNEGDARIGTYFLGKHFTPDFGFSYDGKKYNTMSFYLSATPFKWMEFGYTFTLFKTLAKGYSETPKYNQKDRYFSIKLNPIRESKYIPAIVIGGNDIFSTAFKSTMEGGEDGNYYFSNYYIAVTKHIRLNRNIIGINVAYRKWKRDYNSKWEGVVGGITFQPSFQKNLRAIAEYTGDDINIGFDWLLWKHLLIQSSLQNGKYFSGGICFQMNLF